MGHLYYGSNSYAVEIDDRPLAHLRVAILSTLRAGRCVAFDFERALELGSGRETLWISPSTEIRFLFESSRPLRINEQWVRSILATADLPTGLRLVSEPEPPVPEPQSAAERSRTLSHSR